MDKLSDMFTHGTQRLIHDTYYVAHVFKKTEKICNAVYFITSHTDDVSVGQFREQSAVVREVEASALALLGHVHASLSRTRDELPVVAPTLSLGILDLQSKLGILSATGRLPREHLMIFREELDTLERAIYFHDPNALSVPLAAKSARVLTKKTRAPASRAIPSSPTQVMPPAVSDTSSRSERVTDILARKPLSSIKDISREFGDVSEKTIQRELNALIERGVVRKEGEKRWSRYALTDSNSAHA